MLILNITEKPINNGDYDKYARVFSLLIFDESAQTNVNYELLIGAGDKPVKVISLNFVANEAITKPLTIFGEFFQKDLQAGGSFGVALQADTNNILDIPPRLWEALSMQAYSLSQPQVQTPRTP